MSDIFVSYASADRDRARAIAQALTDQGWSVWWDRTIPPGRQFDEVIEEALDSARCVVVLWSKASTASQWVKTEAAEAMRRKILVPVLIEDVKIPLEFRRLQAADLSTWTGGNTHEEVQKFFASIATNVGQLGAAPTAEPRPQAQPHAEAAPTPVPRPAPPPEPRPVPQPEPVGLVPPPPAPKSKSKALLFGAAGIASIVVIAVGYTAYNERAKRQAMEQRAEQERKAAEEARRVAEEAAARAKLAQEAAAKEAAQRRAEQERRAADDARRAADAAAQARSAKLAQEEAARAKAAQDAKAAQEAAAKAAAAKQQQQNASNTSVMRINWYDHALRFNGQLSGKPSSASLQATVYDIKTGTQIGTYDVPAAVTKQGTDFVVTGTFQVPKDSVTPYPHAHTSRLLLRRQNDGSLRYIENCPQAGQQCYR